MVRIEDFRRADTSTDWEAFHSARVAEGSLCQTCRCQPTLNVGRGPQTCADCGNLITGRVAAFHRGMTRCPDCRRVQPIADEPREELRAVRCQGCRTVYEVKVLISFSYGSPAVNENAGKPPAKARRRRSPTEAV